MSIFLSLVLCGLLAVFLAERMYRAFSIGAGIYVALWSYLTMDWSLWVSIPIFFATWLFMEFLFHGKIRRS